MEITYFQEENLISNNFLKDLQEEEMLINNENEQVKSYSSSFSLSFSRQFKPSFEDEESIFECNTFEVCPDEKQIASGYSNGYIRVFNIVEINKTTAESSFSSSVTNIKWNGNSQILVSLVDGSVYLLYINKQNENFKVINHIKEGFPINSIDISLDKSYLVSGSSSGDVSLYSLHTKSRIKLFEKNSIEGKSQSNRVFSVRFSTSNNSLFCSGGWSREVIFYDIRERKALSNSFSNVNICGESIDFKNNYVLTGSWDDSSQIKLWDIRMFGLLSVISDSDDIRGNLKSSYVYSCRFHKKNEMICMSSCNNNQFLIIDKTEKKEKVKSEELSVDNFLYSTISGCEYNKKACYKGEFISSHKLYVCAWADGNIKMYKYN